MSYHLAPAWFEGVEAAIDGLEEVASREPAGFLLLSEHVLRRLEQADLDDSDGWLSQAFPRLEALHASACEHLGLKGTKLAVRLLALAAMSDMEAFHNAPTTHEAALGDAGINRLLKP